MIMAIEIRKHGRLMKTTKTLKGAFSWISKNQNKSVESALGLGGWSVNHKLTKRRI